jgi:ATP-dependent Clp protease adaptor protein ClpS
VPETAPLPGSGTAGRGQTRNLPQADQKETSSGMSRNDSGIKEKSKTEPQDLTTEPPMYKVLLLNDDYTTMDFVIAVLVQVFGKTAGEATRIMLDVHRRGAGVCGIYSFEIAETKVETVHSLARENGFPLKCTMERDG